MVLGLNAVSDGRNVLTSSGVKGSADQRRAGGHEPLGLGLSELLKAGGGVERCTPELHSSPGVLPG